MLVAFLSGDCPFGAFEHRPAGKMDPKRISRRHCFFSVLAAMAICIAVAGAGFGQDSDAEPQITLESKNRPLGEVLDQISRETGYVFTIDESWQDRPIKASLQNVPLHRALKRILSSLNHALIYESETEIRIAIYGEASPRGPGAPPPAYTAPRSPVEEPPEPEPAEQPETETSREIEASEAAAEPSDTGPGAEDRQSPPAEDSGQTATDGSDRSN